MCRVTLGIMVQVDRSVALLKRLTGERGRWEQGSETFKNQMSTIIGDVLLMSAFMAYAGTSHLYLGSNCSRHKAYICQRFGCRLV